MNKKVKKLSTILVITALCAVVAACGSKPETDKNVTAGGGATPSVSPSASPSSKPSSSPAATSTAGTGTPNKKTWTAAPAMTIDSKKSYEATFDTNKGSFKVALFADTAPKTVNSFVFLAKENFYNNVVFHRIIKTFMIQTGDPQGTGGGGPGYNIPDELKTTHKYETGTVAMANTGQPNSGGSQFFICMTDECGGLNSSPKFTIFGKVSEGLENVQKIASTPVKANARGEVSVPTEEVKINSITITEK
ncbi:MAG: cyclophilin-type peptidyl-prolyl cis-trans isomerase [Paenibacillus sp.]|nr:cyclophilin-type peptidyl-prolyl cis-trans isomerase [Paenibacillus sp.]